MSNEKLYNYIIKPPPPQDQAGAAPARLQRITVIDKSKIKNSDRIKVIQKIFKGGVGQAPHTITITSWDKTNHRGTIILDDGEPVSIDVKTMGDAAKKTQVALAFKKQAPQSGGAAFIHACGKLFSKYRENEFNTLQFLARLLILPLWGLYQMLTTMKKKEARLQTLLGSVGAPTPENFLETLSLGIAYIEKVSPSGDQEKVLQPLREGVDLGKELLTVVENPALRGKFTREFEGRIKNLQPNHSLLIPAGYYVKDEYHPVLLSVRREGDQFIVQKYAVWTPDASHTGRISAFEEFNVSKSNISKLTDCVLTLLEKPKAAGISEERLKAAGLDTEKYRATLKAHADPVRAVLATLGTARAEKGRAVTPSDDPWKLIFAYVTSADPELLLDKTVFMTQILGNTVSEMLKLAERLPVAQREAYYQALDVRIKHLEAHLLKLDPELADALIAPLKAEVHQSAAQSRAKMLVQGETRTIRALTDPGKSAPLHLSIPSKIAQNLSARDLAAQQEKAGGVGIVANRADLHTLERLFKPEAAVLTRAQAVEALGALQALHTKIDQLIEAQDYVKARAAATLALSTLPHIDNRGAFHHFTMAQMDEMSQRIEQLTGQLFEAKLRLSDDHPTPEELVHILNGKALLVSMLRTRIHTVEEKAKRLYLDKSAEERAALKAKYGIPDTFEDVFVVRATILKMKELHRENDRKYKELNTLNERKAQAKGDADLGQIYRGINMLESTIADNKKAIDKLRSEPRNFDDEAAKFKIIGALLKDLRIPLEEAQLISFSDYTLDSENDRSLLEDNPYLSFGYNPDTAKKAASLAEFFVSDRGELSERSAVLLNAFENEELFAPAEHLFSGRLQQLDDLYGVQRGAKIPKTEIERQDGALLPKFLIDLRRSEAWSDAVFNPKGSLYLGFTTDLGSKNWLLGNIGKASEGTEFGDENFCKKLRILQSQDIRRRLGDMDRVTLSIQMTALDGKNPAVIFSSRTEAQPLGFASTPALCPHNSQAQRSPKILSCSRMCCTTCRPPLPKRNAHAKMRRWSSSMWAPGPTPRS